MGGKGSKDKKSTKSEEESQLDSDLVDGQSEIFHHGKAVHEDHFNADALACDFQDSVSPASPQKIPVEPSPLSIERSSSNLEEEIKSLAEERHIFLREREDFDEKDHSRTAFGLMQEINKPNEEVGTKVVQAEATSIVDKNNKSK